MSEERAIRINKVLRELNISLDRAVEFLKDKGHVIEASPNAKISGQEYNALFNQFSADKGNKAASLEVSEEKRKEKEALRIEREKELEEKRKQDEDKQRQEVIRARATLSGPVSVGKIDLNPKKAEPASDKAPAKQQENPVKQEPQAEKPQPAAAPKPAEAAPVAQKQPEQPKIQAQPQAKEEKPATPVQETKPAETPAPAAPAVTPAAETATAEPATTEAAQTPAATATDATGAPEEEKITTQYQKLSGTTFTGQTIDLSQFNKPKKKKEEPKKDPAIRPNTNNNNAADKNKRKRITPNPNGPNKPPQGQQGAAVHVRTPGGAGLIRPNTGGQANTGGGKFGPNKRPAIVSKVEPTEEEVKNQIRETLEKLQGKGGKSKAAKYRRDKRDSHRQRTDDEQRAVDEGSKTIQVTEFVTVGEVATMMDVPITKVISVCMSLGIMVTMNQRLDAETLTIVADEFGYEIKFITTDIEEAKEVVADKEEDLV